MPAAYPALQGLRRIPRQARSMARVDAVIDALFELVAEVERPSELTTADVATRAEVPLGSLYEYFEDLSGIVDAAISKALDRHDELLQHVGEAPPKNLRQLVDTLFDTYYQLYVEVPGFLALRNSTLFEQHHRREVQGRIVRFVRTISTSGTALGVFTRANGTAERLEFLFAIGDSILQAALRDGPPGDPMALEEGRAIIHYAARRAINGLADHD